MTGNKTEYEWIMTEKELKRISHKSLSIPWDEDLYNRQRVCGLIVDLGFTLNLRKTTIAIACYYNQRFHVKYQYNREKKYVLALTIVNLACKAVGKRISIRELIKASKVAFYNSSKVLDRKEEIRTRELMVFIEKEVHIALDYQLKVIHPELILLKYSKMLNLPKDVYEAARCLLFNSQFLTHFALVHQPKTIVSMIIFMALKWSNYEIPKSTDGKPYWFYLDPKADEEFLENLSLRFLQIINEYPTRLKRLKSACKIKEEMEIKAAKTKQML